MGKTSEITGNKTCKSVLYTHIHVLFPVFSLFLPISYNVKKSLNEHRTIDTLVFEIYT